MASSRFTPIDAEGRRTLGPGQEVHWTWFLPWCCWSCRRFGEVPVDVTMTKRSTDDEVAAKVERSHWEASSLCISRKMQTGARVYRWKNGEKLYLRFPNEKEHEVTAEPWPPWTDRA